MPPSAYLGIALSTLFIGWGIIIAFRNRNAGEDAADEIADAVDYCGIVIVDEADFSVLDRRFDSSFHSQPVADERR